MNKFISSPEIMEISNFTIQIFNFKPYGFIMYLYYIEILFLLKALSLSILVIILIFKFQLFHVNLRYLFCNQFIANIFFIFIRLAIIINVLTPESIYSLTLNNWLQSIHNGIVEFFSINLISIVIERLQSTLKAASYESYYTFSQILMFICFPWIISFGIILIFQYNLLGVTTIIEGVVLLDAFFLLCFVILQLFNKKRQQSFDIDTTLSYRFQVHENIATMRFLSYLCFVYSMYLVLSMAFLYVIFSIFHKNEQLIPVIVGCCAFDILTAFHCFIIPLIFILANKKFHGFLCICKKQNNPRVTPCPLEEVHDAEIQRKLYFDELRKQWT